MRGKWGPCGGRRFHHCCWWLIIILLLASLLSRPSSKGMRPSCVPQLVNEPTLACHMSHLHQSQAFWAVLFLFQPFCGWSGEWEGAEQPRQAFPLHQAAADAGTCAAAHLKCHSSLHLNALAPKAPDTFDPCQPSQARRWWTTMLPQLTTWHGPGK